MPTGLTTGGVKPGTAAVDPDSAKITDAAQQFEAMMLNELLKPLQFGAGVDEGGGESTGGAADTIRSLATDALGKALSQHGGVGIAQKIAKEITKERNTTKVGKEETKVQ